MSPTVHPIERPQRWNEPLGSDMRDADVDWLLRIEPFRSMQAEAFSRQLPLRGILANACRILQFQSGDVVFREGEYGNSAFLILDGTLTVLLSDTNAGQPADRAASAPPTAGFLARLWSSRQPTRKGQVSRTPGGEKPLVRESTAGTRMFLQNLPSILARGESQVLPTGEFFGELAAINRAPHGATVVATGPARVLEIRWQGLRDLMQRDPALRSHIDQLYRERSLQAHLRETPVLENLDPGQLEQLAKSIEFESYGSMAWTHAWKSTARADIAERILAEPLIARQGEYCDSLLLIRNGFGRVTRTHGHGEQTIEYLGRGGVFGLREMVHNCGGQDTRPWQLSLRATGYVDILRIPADAFRQWVLPQLPAALRPPPLPALVSDRNGSATRRQSARRGNLPTPLLETIVEQRLMNGTEAMVIDLNRCTRCDDCVRACADTHDGTPRFVRDGLIHEQWMFTHACMHCADPVCMIGCPTGAIAREEASGLVLINDQTCIGCGTCANSCPYSNIRMVSVQDQRGVPVVDRASGLPVLQATKCDLCADSGSGPACQRACPHDALIRIDLTTPNPLREWTVG